MRWRIYRRGRNRFDPASASRCRRRTASASRIGATSGSSRPARSRSRSWSRSTGRSTAATCALDDRSRLTTEDICPGSGVLLQLHPGVELTLRDIDLSDDEHQRQHRHQHAHRPGRDGKRQRGDRVAGMPNSALGRKMRGVARPKTARRKTGPPPNDFRACIDAILTGTAASRESCDGMIEMLTLQQNTRRIGRYFPEGTLPWGSKTGTVGTVSHDAGFVRGRERGHDRDRLHRRLPGSPRRRAGDGRDRAVGGMGSGLVS